jgi:type I restriction enzyme S subunit
MSRHKTAVLFEIADIRFSNVDKKSIAGEQRVLLCNYMDAYSNDYITRDLDFMEATATVVEIEKFKVARGDVLITKDSETPYDIGISTVVIDEIEGLVCGYHLALIKPVSTIVDSIFLCKQLACNESARYFSRYAAGSTRYGLSNKAIANVSISLPPLLSQQKIARILKTVDRTIEKTEALIDKYQQIKQGLMHDLFTRGIAAEGKLRPPRSQAPELYKKTSMGWMPKEWGVDYLENLLAPIENNMRSGPFGSSLLKSELVEEGIPFLGIDNIFPEHFHKAYKRFVSIQKFAELHQYAVRSRDVIITIMGTVGRCAVAPIDLGYALSSKHLWTMTLDQEKIIPELACWQLNYASWVSSWFRRETQGGIMDAIRSTTLRALRLPIPPLPEQQRIFQRYETINKKIKHDISHVRKLRKQKAGLMHDLLTGRVEVKVKEKGATHA